jgi:hypothetical protein
MSRLLTPHTTAEARRGLDALQASDPRHALDARLAAVRACVAPRDNAERLALAQWAYLGKPGRLLT